MREFGAPLNAGKIAEITGIDRKKAQERVSKFFEYIAPGLMRI